MCAQTPLPPISRLISLEEVPDYIRQPVVDPRPNADKITDLGPRKRKFVDYTLDRMSNRKYFGRMLGNNNDDDGDKEQQDPPKKKRVRASREGGAGTTRVSRKRKAKNGTVDGQLKKLTKTDGQLRRNARGGTGVNAIIISDK